MLKKEAVLGDLQDELADAQNAYDEADAEYQKLIQQKRLLDADLGDPCVTDGWGRRLTEIEYNKWRRPRISQKLNLEKYISEAKRNRKDAADLLNKLQQTERRNTSVAITETEKGALRSENDLLRRELSEARSTILRLDRQVDELIRQLNAVPKTIR